MEEKELMAVILRILLQRGTINEDIFDNSIKKIKEIHTFEIYEKVFPARDGWEPFLSLGEEKFYIDKKQKRILLVIQSQWLT